MDRSSDAAAGRDIYSVTRLNREVRALLDAGLPALWVDGEVSNLARPSSGHWYFTLKDSGAQVRCAMFRSANLRVRVSPRDGLQVLVRARVSLYEPRGDYQLIVEHLEEAGEGALRRRFEELKARLAAEGLFDAAAKRPLPRLPRRIGVITSPSGAAIRDILHVLRRRFAAVPVLIYPVPVQGAGAAVEIAAAIRRASARAEVDVLILARGGGSLEDLWAFNEELVARAIRDSRIPVIAGIGHEVDVTIADFAADVRAPTPSGAAELAVPDHAEWLRALAASAARLAGAWRRRAASCRERLSWLTMRLARVHPRERLTLRAQRLDELEARLGRALGAALAAARARLLAATRTLNAVSPLATLERGYAILVNADGRLVRAAREVAPGEPVAARTGQGTVHATVTRIED
ncbi:MAG TPA: exodeoxyribonuclease VII large subunit [Steroidobacteraceae bacterium]|nr:exodeoxyribonuclease VII large subunit [Steroidobacteraceae bacterium]